MIRELEVNYFLGCDVSLLACVSPREDEISSFLPQVGRIGTEYVTSQKIVPFIITL
jgi:hypothetical protein